MPLVRLSDGVCAQIGEVASYSSGRGLNFSNLDQNFFGVFKEKLFAPINQKDGGFFTTLGVCGGNMGKEVKLITTPPGSLSYPA